MTKTTVSPLLRVFLLALSVAFAFLLSLQTIQGHAAFARSVPAPNAVLATAPERVQVWFTEPLAPAFSDIQVLDAGGVRVDLGDSALDPHDNTLLVVSLSPLEPGVYTVPWQNVSTVDGHRVAGFFVFSVGEPLAAGPTDPQGENGSLLQYPLDPLVRWLVLLSALGLLGGIVFDLFVLAPVLSRTGHTGALQEVRQALATRRRLLLWAFWVTLLGSSLAQLLFQAASAAHVPFLSVFGAPIASVLSNTLWGQMWLWRMASLLALGGLLIWAYPWRATPGNGSQGLPRVMALLVAALLLLTLSLTSHGATLPGITAQAVTADYLHLLGVGVWFGGLLLFAGGLPLLLQGFAQRERNTLLAPLVARFSLLALLSISTVIMTGLYSGWAQVTAFRALATPYGVTLMAKVALVAPMLLLAALNLLWVRPRLRREGKDYLWLGRFVTGEAVLGLLVLAATGLLTSLEPARQAIGPVESALTFAGQSEGLDITTSVGPGYVGPNTLRVSLVDNLGRPVDGAAVDLRLTYLEADLGEQVAMAAPLGDGTYLWANPFLSVAGVWQGEVTVRRADAFDARTAFRFVLPKASPSGVLLTPDPQVGGVLLALVLGLIGAVFLMVGFATGGMATRTGLAIVSAGVVGVIAGIGIGANVLTVAEEPVSNPFPPDIGSLAIGSRIYVDSCQVCHGPLGRGDGPQAVLLNPRPGDLTLHVPLHPDRDLFTLINQGVPGTAMAPFSDKLTQDEIWHVVNFLRTLQ
ncbi:MAG: copper resistance protein CopC [Chloroflexi bacterium]|nr:copper resistance protein CopC [Chloroflexota bacterium]